MMQHISRSVGECLKMGSQIGEQEFKIAALMIMRDCPSGNPPEPLNAVRIGIIGWRIDKVEVVLATWDIRSNIRGKEQCGKPCPFCE